MIQSISVVVITLALVIYFWQLREMRRQISTTQGIARTECLMDLILFLQTPEIWSARKHVITKLQGSDYSSWSEDDKDQASKVCSSYDIAAILVDLEHVDPDVFVRNYGPSIESCYLAVKDFMDYMRKQAGPTYWDNFPRLYDRWKNYS